MDEEQNAQSSDAWSVRPQEKQYHPSGTEQCTEWGLEDVEDVEPAGDYLLRRLPFSASRPCATPAITTFGRKMHVASGVDGHDNLQASGGASEYSDDTIHRLHGGQMSLSDVVLQRPSHRIQSVKSRMEGWTIT